MDKILGSQKENKSSDNSCLIGMYVTPEMDEYLRMYSLANDVSKSELLRRILRNWTKNSHKPNELRDKIIVDAIGKWNKVYRGSISFEAFSRNLQKELQRAKISDKTVEFILTKVKNGTR